MKGILFKPDMIKAIVEGGKTVTRRTINPQPPDDAIDVFSWFEPGIILDKAPEGLWVEDKNGLKFWGKPRYQVGEVVYIKEAHRFVQANADSNSDFAVVYPDGELKFWRDNGDTMNYPIDEKRRSPLFMPAWAARYFIKITDVRAERLQEIENEPDGFVKEGYIPLMIGKSAIDGKPFEASLDFAWYENLWDIINGEGDYALNKWVWRYEFNFESPSGVEEKR